MLRRNTFKTSVKLPFNSYFTFSQQNQGRSRDSFESQAIEDFTISRPFVEILPRNRKRPWMSVADTPDMHGKTWRNSNMDLHELFAAARSAVYLQLYLCSFCLAAQARLCMYTGKLLYDIHERYIIPHFPWFFCERSEVSMILYRVVIFHFGEVGTYRIGSN